MNRIPSIVLLLVFLTSWIFAEEGEPQAPNVIVILVSDMGYGDFGVTGNSSVKSPNIDTFSAKAVSWEQFYVSPLRAPTKASLLTGRYHYRTNVSKSIGSGSMMASDEVTLAEVLASAGYNTGAFGQWELGDHYPMRASDQGFEETFLCKGKLDQYFDPVLYRNNREVQARGFCSDVYTDSVIRFVRNSADHGVPFFCYLAYNSPELKSERGLEDWIDYYQGLREGGLQESEVNRYAFASNLDENIGKLLSALEETNQAKNTLVIFLSANEDLVMKSSQELGGIQGGLYESGVRSPLWLRWPAELQSRVKVKKSIAGHIDLMPTILEACQVGSVDALELDGRSLLPKVLNVRSELSERAFVTQAHSGNRPVKYQNFMIRKGDWKLLHSESQQKKGFELYKISEDPSESNNLIGVNRDKFEALKVVYEDWFDDVLSTREGESGGSYILMNRVKENPVVLTRSDYTEDGRNTKEEGHWKLDFQHSSRMNVSVDVSGDVDFDVSEVYCKLTVREESWVSQVEGKKVYFDVVSLSRGKQNLNVEFYDSEDNEVDLDFVVRLTHR